MDAIKEFSTPGDSESKPTRDLLSGYSYLEPTDVAYAKVTPCFENGKGLVGTELAGPTFATTEVTVLRPRPGVEQRFLAYLLQSSEFREPAIASMIGAGGLKRVSEAVIKNALLPSPPAAEQRQIADYLDHETAEIDAFISEQLDLSRLLSERRKAEITHAVTKGIKSNARLTASDNIAIGSYPSHWELRKIKYLGETIIGLTYSPEDIVTSAHEGTLVIRAGNIQGGQLTADSPVYVSKTIPSKLRLREGDIVICARNGSANLVGKNALASEPFFDSTWGAFMVVLRSNFPDYLRWFLNSEIFSAQSGSFSTTTINQLTSADLGNSVVALPPASERKEIDEFLRGQVTQFDNMSKSVRLLIDLARERRAALITAAVTGQIDVTARNKPAAEQLEDDIAQGLLE